jgi:phage I-like protein
MNNPIDNEVFELPADGWFHLAPRGEHIHPATGVTQVIDEAALRAICQNFQAAAALPGFSGALVDYDHFSYDPRRPSEAAGWIVALKAESGPVPQPGLWARIRWTPEGRNAVQAGRYRFLSPVWLVGDCKALNDADRKRMRPLRLDSAGLTNNPNLKDLAPLSNRNNRDAGPQNPFLPNLNNNNKNSMKNIQQALGLGPEAAEEQAVAEITQLKNRATAAESRIRVLAEENQALAALRAEADLDRFQNRFAPAARDKWRTALLANRQTTLELLESLSVPTSLPPVSQHLRAATKTPDIRPLANRAAEQRQAVLEYKARHQCGWQQAWDALRSQTPELFSGQP